MQKERVCPHYRRAVEVLGKRWMPLIVRALLAEPRRFTQITAYVPGLSDHVLSQRLQELEQAGIVERRVRPCRPVLVEYSLTSKGRALEPVVEALQRWAERWENTGTQASPGVPPQDTEDMPFHVGERGRP